MLSESFRGNKICDCDTEEIGHFGSEFGVEYKNEGITPTSLLFCVRQRIDGGVHA